MCRKCIISVEIPPVYLNSKQKVFHIANIWIDATGKCLKLAPSIGDSFFPLSTWVPFTSNRPGLPPLFFHTTKPGWWEGLSMRLVLEHD